MMSRIFLISVFLGLVPFAALAKTQPHHILLVGPGQIYTVPSQAAAVAQDGDIVNIASGIYSGDVAVWRANRLTLIGAAGRAILRVQGHIAEGKAIWVIKGDDTRVENIEFTGAAVPDHNGAGIRQEGRNLTVQHCFFHDNEDGILTGAMPGSDIVVENSEFNHNGQGDGYSHNLYIGHVRSFTLRGCWSHNAHVGHDVKSRAQTNTIVANKITDDDGSDTSYLLDFPDGGDCRVIGNVFRRGPTALNGTMLTFAEEGATNTKQTLVVINNTLVIDHPNAMGVRFAGNPAMRLINNLFVGAGQWVSGTATEMAHNQAAVPADFRDARTGEYHLRPGSAAIAAGIEPGKDGDFDLTPGFEFDAAIGARPRRARRPLDLGAFAYQIGKE